MSHVMESQTDALVEPTTVSRPPQPSQASGETRRAARFVRALGQRGPRFAWYLLTGVLAPRVIGALPDVPWLKRLRWLGLLVAAALLAAIAWWHVPTAGVTLLGLSAVLLAAYGWRELATRRLFRAARRLTDDARRQENSSDFTLWRDLDVAAEVRRRIEAQLEAGDEDDLVVGRIDGDGRLRGIFGELPGLDPVDEGEFLERSKHDLSVVLRDGHVLVRKDFGSRRRAFAREWHALAVLRGRANVPAVYDADVAQRRLYSSFIAGRTMRDILFAAGAQIRDVETNSEEKLNRLSRAERKSVVAARGTALVGSCFSESFLDDLQTQLNAVHRGGVANLDVKFGNVVVNPKTGQPWLVDFEAAQCYGSLLDAGFVFKRNRDRLRFNRICGLEMLTETSARRLLREELDRLHRDSQIAAAWYTAIDFGAGLTVGDFWDLDSATGLWETWLAPIVRPLVEGARVLDLGAGPGTLSMTMLRTGAREVVAVEPSTAHTRFAECLQQVFEWRDARPYGLHLHRSEIATAFTGLRGPFDAVTAFGSLDDLPNEAVESAVRRAAELSPTIVVMTSNDPMDPSRQEAHGRTEWLRHILTENGFQEVSVFDEVRTHRSLLVGQCPDTPN